ncbi:replication-relaxation family protein [Parafrankia sp. FMc6]|uniref:replication-relaxation family protein n=1 Tax=Parafrankia soli TaxID=2599596 RepID=UPI0034D5D055
MQPAKSSLAGSSVGHERFVQTSAAAHSVEVRPDAYGRWPHGGVTVEWFLELDYGTEPLNASPPSSPPATSPESPPQSCCGPPPLAGKPASAKRWHRRCAASTGPSWCRPRPPRPISPHPTSISTPPRPAGSP